MPITEQILVAGNRGLITADGPQRVQEVYFVEGIDLTGQLTLAQALTDDIPDIGDAHTAPAFDDLAVVSIEPEMVSRDQARVVVTYGRPDLKIGEQARFWVEGSQQVQRRNRDIYGAPITTQKASGAGDEGHFVDTGVPQITLRFQIARAAYPGGPSGDIELYLNTENLLPIWGYGLSQLLCTRINAVSRRPSEGGGYLVDYAFQANTDSWAATVTATDDATGQPIEDPDIGTTEKSYTVYPQVDWEPLELSGLVIP